MFSNCLWLDNDSIVTVLDLLARFHLLPSVIALVSSLMTTASHCETLYLVSKRSC